MPIKTKVRLAVLTAWAGLACGQEVRHGSLGFVLDSASHRVRPLLGVPGAATVGDSIDLGADIVSLATSPNQDFFLAVAADGSASLWTRATGIGVLLGNVPAGAAQVTLSPNGSAAVFFYPDTGLFLVFTGFPSAPAAHFGGTVADQINPSKLFAVSDDGAEVLVSESAPSVAIFTADGLASRISLAGAATAIAFLGNSRDALLSGSAESALVRAGARITLPGAVNGAVGIVASFDASNAFFAHPSGKVTVVSLLTFQTSTLDCLCAPSGIYRTAAPSVYRLNGFTGGPISLFDASSSQTRALLIPPFAARGNQ